jgi:chromosome partitioning protein
VKKIELLGTAEVADLLGVTKQVLSNWRARETKFPAPVVELRSGPVWDKASIVQWAREKGHALVNKGHHRTPKRKQEAVVVAVVNMKGGVGKSTITANLGWYSAYRRNRKVLLIDLDPQFNLSQFVLGIDRYEEIITKKKPTVFEIFQQFAIPPGSRRGALKAEDAICSVKNWSDGSCLDIVPSKLELAWTLKGGMANKECLSNFVDDIRKSYDLILIDCPPTESGLTEAAYLSSDFLLVPVKPEFLSTIGLPLLAISLEDFLKQHRDHHLKFAGILFNAVSNNKHENIKSKQDVLGQAKKLGWHVFENEISYSDSYPKGSRAGTPIFLTDYARSDRVAEFEALADEFSERIGI